MEGVLPEVRRQIIADFYRKKCFKGGDVYLEHFEKMGCKKIPPNIV